MRTRSLLPLILLTFVAACDQPPPTAPAVEASVDAVLAAGQKTRTTDVLEIPVDEVIYLECAGEEIRFTGTTRQSITTVDDGDGTMRLRIKVQGLGALPGIGLTTGTRYTLQSTGTGNVYFDFNEYEGRQHQAVKSVVTSSGPHTANYRLMQVFTITIKDGVTEIDIRVDREECR